MANHAIGIDLGTTYSCVAVYKKGRVEIFENDNGHLTTPSYVAFTEYEKIVGDEAKNYICEDPSNTVFEAKRLIGRKFNDKEVQKDMKQWPFTVKDRNGEPIIEVKYQNETKQYMPQQISAMVLTRLKEIAEEKLGVSSVTRAVITVPAYFNDSQRQATKDAARIAGLDVMQLINEPTAAAIAFTYNKKEGKKNVLVYDLGGGTFDVSVLSIEDGGSIEVKAVGGDTHLGGSDFDQRMVEHFLVEIKSKYGKDLSTDEHKRARLRLRHACENAKRSLNSQHQARVEIDSLFDGQHFRSTITRAKFEALCDDLMRGTLVTVEKALTDAKLSKEAIDEVVLVGGSTRILKVQTLLQEYFVGKTLNKSVNPDEAVAVGAAIQAAVIRGDKDEGIAGVNLKDVTPLSYGTDLINDEMDVLIPRNTPYPTSQTVDYVNGYDNEVLMLIQILQGERLKASENELISEFTLQLTPGPRGTVTVSVTYEIDANGTLVVSAVEKLSGVEKKVTITNIKGRLSEAEIDQMVKEAERLRVDDEKFKARVYSKNALEDVVYKLKKGLNGNTLAGNDQRIAVLKRMVEETLLWIAANPMATHEEFDTKARELQAQKDLLNL